MDAPETNREIAKSCIVYDDEEGFYIEASRCRIEAALLEADKNGYERGRKEVERMKAILVDEALAHGTKCGMLEEDEALLRDAYDALIEADDVFSRSKKNNPTAPTVIVERLKARLAPSGSLSEGKP